MKQSQPIFGTWYSQASAMRTAIEVGTIEASEVATAEATANGNRRYFRVSEAAIFDVVKNGIPGTVMPSSGLS